MALNTIFFIGPQGSGKGTQGKLLSERLGFLYWDMGAICREEAAKDYPLGRKVKELIDNGYLLSDDILLQVADQRLGAVAPDRGIIFDGIPRRIGQAHWLMDYLKEQGRKDFTTVLISLPREDSIARLLARAEKEGRADDTREKIEFRLKQYEEATVPVVEFLKTCTKFVEIDGRPGIPQVTAAISASLGLNA